MEPLGKYLPRDAAGMLAGLGSGGGLGCDVHGGRNDGYQHFLGTDLCRGGIQPNRHARPGGRRHNRNASRHAWHLGAPGARHVLLRPACPVRSAAEPESEPSLRPGGMAMAVRAGVLAAMILLAGVPLGNLVYKAGVLVSQTDTGRVRTWSAGKCVWSIVLAPWQCRRECMWSIVIGGLAATAAVAAAIPLAWLARKSHWLGALAIGVALVCLVVPGPFLALGDHRAVEPAGLAVAVLAVRPIDTGPVDGADGSGAGAGGAGGMAWRSDDPPTHAR